MAVGNGSTVVEMGLTPKDMGITVVRSPSGDKGILLGENGNGSSKDSSANGEPVIRQEIAQPQPAPVSTKSPSENQEVRATQSQEVSSQGNSDTEVIEPVSAELEKSEQQKKLEVLMAEGVDGAKKLFLSQINLLEKSYNNGDFENKPLLKEKAEKVLEYSTSTATGEVNKGNSDAFKAGMELFATIEGEDPALVLESMKQNGQVAYEGQFYNISDWEQKLATATPEDQAKMNAEGLYAFKSSEAPDSEAQTEEIKARLKGQVELLEKEIERKKLDKEDYSKEKNLLINLKSATDIPTGDYGAFHQKKVLENIRSAGIKGMAAEDVNKLIADLEIPAKRGEDKIMNDPKVKLLTDEERKIILSGNLEEMIKQGIHKKIAGLDETILGRKITEDEALAAMGKNVDAEHAKKLLKTAGLGIGGLILLIFLGVIQAASYAGSQNR